MKVTILKLVCLSMLLLLLLPSNAVIASPSPAGSGYRLSGEAWAKSYYEFFGKHNLKINFRLMLPQVWLFSPKGDMVRLSMKDTDPKLESLAADFPESVTTDPLPQQPTSAQAKELLSQALSDPSVPPPSDGKWYAILFLLDRPVPHACDTCATYDKELAAIEAKHSNLLDTVRVTIVLNR